MLAIFEQYYPYFIKSELPVLCMWNTWENAGKKSSIKRISEIRLERKIHICLTLVYWVLVSSFF